MPQRRVHQLGRRLGVVMARLRRGPEQDPHGAGGHRSQVVRLHGLDVDARERDVLLDAVERHQAVGRHPAAHEDRRVDDGGMQDHGAREAVDADVGVLVVTHDEARDAQAPGRHGGRPGGGEQHVGTALGGEEAAQLMNAADQGDRLARPPAAGAGPEDMGLDARLREHGDRGSVVARGDDGLRTGALEGGTEREQVLDLRRVVDVQPELHRDAA
jgi:hypothetical protein